MNSFQAKIGWKQMRKREIKIIVPFCSVPTQCVCNRKFQEKNSKKIKKIKKNTITGSFQAKIGWKRLRKRENKNYCSVSFLHDK